MTDLPPFSEKPTCPKCGGTRIRVFWRAASINYLNRSLDLPEHVVRCCKRCHYGWRELPLDATPAIPGHWELKQHSYVNEDGDLVDTTEMVSRFIPDDEPEDAYLAGKLAAHIAPDAQKPASTARKDDEQPESQDRQLARLQRTMMVDHEPSIPVSRIVAVLAERIDRWTRNSDGASDSRVFWGDLECRAVANELGFTDALDAELARRKGTA